MVAILKSYKLYRQLDNSIKHKLGIRDVDLFVHKLKPAVFLHPKLKGYYELKKLGYPFLQLTPTSRLYAQSEELLASFKETGLKEDKNGVPFHHDKMGRFLGFPEVAVHDFVKGAPMNKRVFIKYHGIPFVVHEDNVYEALEDMKLRIPVPFYFNTRLFAYKRFRNDAIPFSLHA
ncbi:hypothetical protein CN918_30005 [Priestia megaterium]|nr:hypothetical protein CN918_30005 [Priestia megaterium]